MIETLVILWFALAIYFVPSILAFDRKVSSPWSVFVINLLLGWTLIGWAVALALAVRTVPPQQEAHR